MKKLVIKKAVIKAEAVKVTAKKATITELILATLGKDIKYNFQKLAAMVKAKFPKSKWDETHYAWYKSKIKAGAYNGRH